jgi:hypothetical protein
MSPAHEFLYSNFDSAIGHHRRYNVHPLASVAPPTLDLEYMRYLDSVGMLASLVIDQLAAFGQAENALHGAYKHR